MFSISTMEPKNFKIFLSPLTRRNKKSVVESLRVVLRARVISLYNLCLFNDFTKSTTPPGKAEEEAKDEEEEEWKRSSNQGGLLRYI